jgi:hypothetical protein
MEKVEIEKWQLDAQKRTMEEIRKIAEEIDERVRDMDIQVWKLMGKNVSEETRHQALDTLNFDVWQLKRLMDRLRDMWIL